jgi:carboxymethylenebutenolidase
VGVVGFSLGAYLALAVATQEPRIGALVDCFGGLPVPFESSAASLPPVLILHGDADPVVPVEEARKLARLLRAAGRPHEMQLYPGGGHGFRPAEGRDAFARVLAFFDRHLAGRYRARTPA